MKLKWLLAGILVGVAAGVLTYQSGVAYACPPPGCVDSARVTPVTDRDYFSHAYRILSEAEESIHIVAFELKYYRSFPDSLQNRLVRQLIYAHERGVDVKVVVDEFSEQDNAYDIMTENGVEIKYDGRDRTTHAKLIIVDGRIVLIGSTNFSYYGLEKNREANVLIEDEAVAQYYENYFQGVWGSS